MSLHIVPVTFAHARDFVEGWHRHNKPPIGHKFSIGVATDAGLLVGVAMIGRPVARAFDDGLTLEVNRTATDGTPNANSMLYGAAWRAAKALGYSRLVTYTQAEESGASLRAGWVARGRRATSTQGLGCAVPTPRQRLLSVQRTHTLGGDRMTDIITIPLPWSKPPLTGNRTRGNPYARAAEVKTAKDQAIAAVARVARRPIVGAEVTLHFQPKDRRRRDADGMAPTLKVCLDALVLQGILPDDSWVCVPAVSCRIHPPTGEPAAMWLELTDITHYQETTP